MVIKKQWITLVLVLIPSLSIWPSFAYYLLSGKIVKVENLAREGLFGVAIAAILASYLQEGGVPKIARRLQIWILAVAGFAILAVGMSVPIGGVLRDTRDSATILVSIFVGYHYCRYSSLRTALLVVIMIAVPFVMIERLFTPVVFWRELGFFDFLLENARISAGATSSDGFQGYYSEANIDAVFLNYDKFLQGGDVIFRCGGIFGSPIVFGHFLSGITCFFFYDWKVRKRSVSIIPLLCTVVMGLFFIRTKGYSTSSVIFVGFWIWQTRPKLRALLVVLVLAFGGYFLSKAFANNLTAAQHILIFYDYWQLSLKSPVIGSGVGSGLYDDSYLGRLMVEGGFVLTMAFVAFIWKLVGDLKKSAKHSINQGFILACAFPLVFTTAGTSFISMYLFGMIIGVFLREGEQNSKNNDTGVGIAPNT